MYSLLAWSHAFYGKEPLPPETEPTADTQAKEPTSESQNATISTTEPTTQTDQPEKTIPWWVLVLVGLGAAGLGVGTAVILIKKK